MLKKKIMIVDDEKEFLMVAKLNLERTGRFEVITLLSAGNIIAELHKFKPDVVLLDMIMPKLGGIEACGMLNNDPLGKGIPIIALSALDKDADKLKASKVGVVDYLVKPIEIDKLTASIEKALKYK